jgi:hypothetical protein
MDGTLIPIYTRGLLPLIGIGLTGIWSTRAGADLGGRPRCLALRHRRPSNHEVAHAKKKARGLRAPSTNGGASPYARMENPRRTSWSLGRQEST